MKVLKTILKLIGYILIAGTGGYVGNEVMTTLMQ